MSKLQLQPASIPFWPVQVRFQPEMLCKFSPAIGKISNKTVQITKLLNLLSRSLQANKLTRIMSLSLDNALLIRDEKYSM